GEGVTARSLDAQADGWNAVPARRGADRDARRFQNRLIARLDRMLPHRIHVFPCLRLIEHGELLNRGPRGRLRVDVERLLALAQPQALEQRRVAEGMVEMLVGDNDPTQAVRRDSSLAQTLQRRA